VELSIELDREDDGRWIAEALELPGVMTYGESREKARRALAALQRIGWRVKRQSGSHKLLAREGWPDYEFAFHDNDELGRKILSRIAKHTGLRPEDL
jgi:predicted RNA binding protein YcfA (HicA-like mRNA interferase family)